METMAGNHAGRLELTWTDKEKTLLSTGDGRYDYTFVDPSDYRVSEVRLLHEVDRVDVPVPEDRPEDLPKPTADNLLISGDAMHVLDALAKSPEYSEKYLGKVKLAYIDPPFNTGQAFEQYEDNIEHSIWLTMLRDRLRQIKPLLSDVGSVWVHLDDVEVHRCRAVLDEEFGPEKFVAEVAWQKADSPRNDLRGISVSHDTILVYSKSGRWTPNRVPRLASTDNAFGNQDGDPVLWRKKDPTAPGGQERGLVCGIQHPISGKMVYPGVGRHWAMAQAWLLDQMSAYADYELREIDDAAVRARISGVPLSHARSGVKALMLVEPLDVAADRAKAIYAAGTWPELYLTGPGGSRGIQRKQYISDEGRVPETWWPHTEVGHNRSAKNEIKALFPGDHPFSTPKPERLLERIIHIATDPGDIVLDCFAGSGTSAAVAHKMGRRWVTCELLPANVSRYTKPRLEKVVRGQDPGGITKTTKRVAIDGLPYGITPEEAQEFNRLLSKIAKHTGLDDRETVKRLRDAGKTRDESTTIWHGGGGFTHLEVGPSMFEELEGMVLLAEWATRGELAKAMCAQLEVMYAPDGIFAAKAGTVRYAIIDGLVGESTIRSILDQLPEGQIVEVWATQVAEGAADLLRKHRKGSRLEAIPDSVLDRYRRKATVRSPFKKEKTVG